jgi:methyl-accepting chemotaxis protein
MCNKTAQEKHWHRQLNYPSLGKPDIQVRRFQQFLNHSRSVLIVNWFADCAIKWKIIASFTAIILCLALVIVSALSTLDSLRTDIATALLARSLRNHANIMRQNMLEALLDNPKADNYLSRQNHFLAEISDTTKKMKSGLDLLRQELSNDSVGLTKLNSLEKSFAAYVSSRDEQEIPLLKNGKIDDALALSRNSQDAIFQTLRDTCGDLSDHVQSVAEGRAQMARNICIFTGLSSILVACYFSWLLNHLIALPLSQITKAANLLTVGELEITLPDIHSRDEVGSLNNSMALLTQSWKHMGAIAARVAAGDLQARITPRSDKDSFVITFNLLVQVIQEMSNITVQFREAASVVSTSASQILAAVTESAAGATQAAAAATETTTIVEEVRQTSHVANDKARLVSDGAQRTAQMTTTGRQATQGLIDGMNAIRSQVDLIAEAMVRLSEKTQSISGIIKTVDDLAKQSNRLAVNASIEAARAGDAGKGFAVVANEVRNLAEQSKQSTMQIRSILMEIQDGTNAATMATELGGRVVDAALQQSNQANQTISYLASSVVESAQAASQIAVSSQQQLTGVDEVASAMSGIRTACTDQLNAIKQVESAAHRLNDIGQILADLAISYENWESSRTGTDG